MKDITLTTSAWIVVVVFLTLMTSLMFPPAIVISPLAGSLYLLYRSYCAYRDEEIGDTKTQKFSFWFVVTTLVAVVVWCVTLIVGMFTD